MLIRGLDPMSPCTVYICLKSINRWNVFIVLQRSYSTRDCDLLGLTHVPDIEPLSNPGMVIVNYRANQAHLQPAYFVHMHNAPDLDTAL